MISRPTGVPVYQCDLAGNILNMYDSAAEAERKTGIPKTNILRVAKNEIGFVSAGGFIWKEVPDHLKKIKQRKVHLYTDAEIDEFNELLKQNKYIIEVFIARHRHWLKSELDYDDFYQCAMIEAWENYFGYIKNKHRLKFSTFLYKSALHGIIKFKRKFFLSQVESKYEEKLENIAGVESTYEEQDIQSLHKAIMDLPEEDLKVIKMYLNEENMERSSLNEGFNKSYYTNKFLRATDKIRRNQKRYFEGKVIQREIPLYRA